MQRYFAIALLTLFVGFVSLLSTHHVWKADSADCISLVPVEEEDTSSSLEEEMGLEFVFEITTFESLYTSRTTNLAFQTCASRQGNYEFVCLNSPFSPPDTLI